MAMFAQIILEPGGVIAWLVVGLIAGFLASRVMGTGGRGLIGDLVVGLIGRCSAGSCSVSWSPATMGSWAASWSRSWALAS